METIQPKPDIERKASVVLETSLPEIKLKLAPPRGYIPREGYFFPRLPPRYDCSVAPKYELSDINDYEVPDDIVDSDNEFKLCLNDFWGGILESRQVIEQGKNQRRLPAYRNNIASLVAFAPTTEELFKAFIVPEIRKGIKFHENFMREEAFIAVPQISYLFPFWAQKELAPVRIVEGNLPKLIKNCGRMDRRVCSVYLDYPPNQLNADDFYSAEEVVKFIEKHRNVLFIIDQANLYFRNQGMNNNTDLMLHKHIGSSDFQYLENVIVTNTTTKTSTSGCAVAAWSGFHNINDQTDIPKLFGFDNPALRKRAISVLHLELPDDWYPAVTSRTTDTIMALTHRQIIQKNREILIDRLRDLFPVGVDSPELVVEGARIIVNANKVGFSSAEELCKFLYENFSIGTKPATVYASPTVKKDWDKYLQITVPWNDEILRAVLDAFDELSQINQIRKNQADILRIIYRFPKII